MHVYKRLDGEAEVMYVVKKFQKMDMIQGVQSEREFLSSSQA